MREPRSIRVLISGQFDAWEFQQVLLGPLAGCEITCAKWHDALQRSDDFDFVFVCQARRGDFSNAEVQVLLHQFPFAQKAVVVGSWCEGETRSGQPVGGVHRIFLRDWTSTIAVLLKEFHATGTSRLSRPVTESLSDYLMSAAPPPVCSGRLNIALHTLNRDCFSTIHEFCDDRKWTVQSLDQCKKCDLVIVECHHSIQEALDLHPQIKKLGDLPVVVICGFPRLQDQQQLSARFHAMQLIGKPFENGCLETAILQLVSQGGLKLVVDVA